MSKSGLAGSNIDSQDLSNIASLSGCQILEWLLSAWLFVWVVILYLFCFGILLWKRFLNILEIGKAHIFL